MKIPPAFSKDIYINILRTEEGSLSDRLFDVLTKQNPAFCVKYAIRCCELIEHKLPPYSKHVLSILKDFENQTRAELEAALHSAAEECNGLCRYHARAVVAAVRAAITLHAVGSVPVSLDVAWAAYSAANHAARVTHEQKIVSLLIDML